MGMKTVQQVYDEYIAWCKENNNSTMSFEDYLWKVCN